MNEMDEILLDQLHSAKSCKKVIKRIKKLAPTDLKIHEVEIANHKRMMFFESMIEDKTLLQKKHKRKKQKDPDILARNPVYEWYRQSLYVTVFSYKMFMDSVSQYMSYFKKGKN
jgi:hypothetical protein